MSLRDEMMDREKAKALVEAWPERWSENEGLDVVAAKARELFGPTPEEKAVIEAADWIVAYFEGRIMTERDHEMVSRFLPQLRVLRTSREPKPRYFVKHDRHTCCEFKGVHEWRVMHESADQKAAPQYVCTAWDKDQAERIARLLNEADR